MLKQLSLLFLSIVLVLGSQSYQDLIPNGYRVEGGEWPGVGHLRAEGRGARNPFGVDFAAYGYVWSTEFCKLDSDGDDFSNGQELGDPECVWKVGDENPGDGTGITHPGFVNDEVPPITTSTCTDFVVDSPVSNTILMNDTVPTGHSFSCREFSLDSTVDMNIVRFDPIIAEGDTFVKEIVVYQCSGSAVLDTCETVPSGCSFLYSASWGASPFCLPNGVGFLSQSTDKYYMQVRYNNPGTTTTDRSGVNITATTTLGIEAGILNLGVITDQLVVSGGQSSISVSNTCPTACLESVVPTTGITFFASRYSAHSYASSLTTAAAEDGENMDIFSSVPFYELDIRETTAEASFTIMRSREVITSCFYDTSSSASDITGGDNITTNERCENFMYYYPKVSGFSQCNTIINSQVSDTLGGTWRDGRTTAQCGSNLMDVDSRTLVPECNDLGTQLQAAAEMATRCASGCSTGTCKQDMISFVQSDCVQAIGFENALAHCADEGVDQTLCDTFSTLFSECDGICAIGLGTSHCEAGETCESDNTCYVIPDAPEVSSPGNIFGIPLLEFFIVLAGVVLGLIIVVIFIVCICANAKK
eukprot:TRINITY_DN2758_c0_g1_i1.p1 TRINITY_DN2758_c0_g1~~TRINITY_DN2758_c0_g1_i1.p1  ORF type:complete len:589 (-),score=128.79 TRINITY_DN2758_c0_g1_i1:12-1778(-)